MRCSVDFADPIHNGQIVSFQYREFTLYACSEVTGVTDPNRARSATNRSSVRSGRTTW